MSVRTLAWEENAVLLLDQTRLPREKTYLRIDNPQTMWQAIKQLSVRGAPAIGDAAAFGLYLGIRDSNADSFDAFYAEVEAMARYLASSRPTAVNLFWALDRMKRVAAADPTATVSAIKDKLLAEAQAILAEDLDTCKAIGRHAEPLIPDGGTVLTHCNAGGLATAGYGTALAGIYTAHESGKSVAVFADETRPLLQGARITAFELMEAGVPVTVICDNMAPVVLREGKIDLVIVGADRIAANGDAANKIGTYGVALAAREHDIPFYVAAPLSTIDRNLADGSLIPIEERDGDEVVHWGQVPTAPEGVRVYNPAFDVTPQALIAGIITEVGVLRAPFTDSIRQAFEPSTG